MDNAPRLLASTKPVAVQVAAAIRSWLRSASNLRRMTSLILRMVFLLAGIPLPQRNLGKVTRAFEVQRQPEARFRFIVTDLSAL